MKERVGIIDCLPPHRGERDPDRLPAIPTWLLVGIVVVLAATLLLSLLRS